MEQTVKLPYCSRYFPGDLIGLRWLKAVTSNDRLSARHLNWHTHDELELIFPLRGHYRYEFKEHRSASVDNESFIVLPKATPHRMVEAIDPPGGRLHLYLRSPSARITPDATFTEQEYARLYQALSRRTLKSIPSTSLLKTTVSALGKIITKSPLPLSDDDVLQVRLLCSLALCTSATAKAPATSRSPSRIFAEAVSWLEQNHSTCVHMDRLIERIGYSRARFFALFKQQTKMTPSEYLRNFRIGKAKEMLMRTDLPAAHVGKACGLGDPAHFSRLFSRMTGYTPLAYRRQMGSCRLPAAGRHLTSTTFAARFPSTPVQLRQ